MELDSNVESYLRNIIPIDPSDKNILNTINKSSPRVIRSILSNILKDISHIASSKPESSINGIVDSILKLDTIIRACNCIEEVAGNHNLELGDFRAKEFKLYSDSLKTLGITNTRTRKTKIEPDYEKQRNDLIRLTKIYIKQQGIDLDKLGKDGNSPLHRACIEGKVEKVELLLSLGANATNENGELLSPIELAMIHKKTECAKFLILNYLDISNPDKNEEQYIDFACSCGLREVVELLIDKGFNINGDIDSNIPLFTAINKKVNECTKLLIERGANVNITKLSETPLHVACKEGLVDIMKLLLQHKANPNVENKDGDTPLLIAISNKNIPAIKALLDAGANPTIKNKNGITPWSKLTEYEDFSDPVISEIAELLISKMDINSRDEHNKTPLHIACEYGIENAVISLINRGANLDAVNGYGCTPINLALYEGHEECARHLLDHGASVTIADNEEYSSFHSACTTNLVDMIEPLLGKFFNIDAKTKSGFTPIYIASMYDSLDTIEELNNRGADKEIPDNDGNTPLLIAGVMGNEDCIKYLIKSGSDVNRRNNENITLFHMACEQGLLDIAKAVLAKSKDTLNEKNKYGNTPLFRALTFGNQECAKLLITEGADLNLLNENGQTALHLACEKGLFEVVELLIKKGCDYNIVDKNGKTPLIAALEKGQLNSAKVLIKYGDNANNHDMARFHDVVEVLKTRNKPKAHDIKKLIVQTTKIHKVIFRDFLDETKKHKDPEYELGIKYIFDRFSKRIDDLAKSYFDKINDSKKNFTKNPEQILSDFRDIYLEFLFEVRENKIIRMIDKYEKDRIKDFKPVLNKIAKSYRDEQRFILENLENSSLVLHEQLLANDKKRVLDDIEIFTEMKNDKYKYLSSDQNQKHDLYVSGGICYGSSVVLAAGRLPNTLISQDNHHKTIQPSSKSRFYQAAYDLSLLGKHLNKKAKELKNESFYDNSIEGTLDVSFQKKLNIEIKSTNLISNLDVYDFIQKIDTLIPKLNTEKSSHFILSMIKPKKEEASDEHSAHAIYCHLTPPYELQDVNYPGFSLKTDDIHQFKNYLCFYFLCIAPVDYQEIEDLEQVTNRSN